MEPPWGFWVAFTLFISGGILVIDSMFFRGPGIRWTRVEALVRQEGGTLLDVDKTMWGLPARRVVRYRDSSGQVVQRALVFRARRVEWDDATTPRQGGSLEPVSEAWLHWATKVGIALGTVAVLFTASLALVPGAAPGTLGGAGFLFLWYAFNGGMVRQGLLEALRKPPPRGLRGLLAAYAHSCALVFAWGPSVLLTVEGRRVAAAAGGSWWILLLGVVLVNGVFAAWASFARVRVGRLVRRAQRAS